MTARGSTTPPNATAALTMVNEGGAREVVRKGGEGGDSSSSSAMMNGNGDAVAATAIIAREEVAGDAGETRAKVKDTGNGSTNKPPDNFDRARDGGGGGTTSNAAAAPVAAQCAATTVTANGNGTSSHRIIANGSGGAADAGDDYDSSSPSVSMERVMQENRRLRDAVARLEEQIRTGGGGVGGGDGGGGGGLLSDLKKRLSSPLTNGGRKTTTRSKHGGGSRSSSGTPTATPRQNVKKRHGDGEYRRILHPSPDGHERSDDDGEEEAELSASYLDRRRFLPVGGGGDECEYDDEETRPLTPIAFGDGGDAEAGDPAVAKKLSPMEVSGDDDDGSGSSSSLYEVENVDGGDADADDVLHEGPFKDVFCDRASWLVGLLVLQSCSSFILERNEKLLQRHLVIVHFLTMLVGAGGNAGNQACVRVIRGLAVGSLNDATLKPFLWTEFKMAVLLSITLATAGFVRAAVFETPLAEMMAITCTLAMIVITSIFIGALLPLVMKAAGIDPAHSCTTIQVMMDIIGVLLTVNVSSVILNTAFGRAHSSPPPDDSDLCP